MLIRTRNNVLITQNDNLRIRVGLVGQECVHMRATGPRCFRCRVEWVVMRTWQYIHMYNARLITLPVTLIIPFLYISHLSRCLPGLFILASGQLNASGQSEPFRKTKNWRSPTVTTTSLLGNQVPRLQTGTSRSCACFRKEKLKGELRTLVNLHLLLKTNLFFFFFA